MRRKFEWGSAVVQVAHNPHGRWSVPTWTHSGGSPYKQPPHSGSNHSLARIRRVINSSEVMLGVQWRTPKLHEVLTPSCIVQFQTGKPIKPEVRSLLGDDAFLNTSHNSGMNKHRDKSWRQILLFAFFFNFACDVIFISKIWGFHGCDYEEWCLLGCYAVWLL
jgi:hypothetical protein